jgi:uncharacterized membrane protein YdcZ (DUF606 family)
MSTVSYAIWAFAAGALIPLMAVLNAGIARTTGGQIQATIILFAIGLIASLLLAVITTVRLPDFHTLLRVAPQQSFRRIRGTSAIRTRRRRQETRYTTPRRCR